ncbi:MAG: TIM barrel protein, partial [Oscillospiraceae bacterium]
MITKINHPFFGPAGNSESFKEKGYKTNLQIPEYLNTFNLNAYEYQCGRGVKISEEAAKAFGLAAKEQNITLSLHAPYYISLSSESEETRLKSVEYILKSAIAANNMGADRIIVHSGSCAKMSREHALSLAKDTIKLSLKALD